MIDANNYKYLLVTLQILSPKVSIFEDKMRLLLPRLFEGGPARSALEWKLLSAVKRPPSTDGNVEYIHLWQLPRNALLADAMVLLGRDTDYYDLDQCKYSEVQDIFSVAQVYCPADSPVGGRPSRGRLALASAVDAPLFIETVEAPADWLRLHRWQDAMPVIAANGEIRGQFSLVFAIQAETGKLRRFVNYWRPSSVVAHTVKQPQNPVARDPERLQQLLAKQEIKLLQPYSRRVQYSNPPPEKYPATQVQVYNEVDYR